MANLFLGFPVPRAKIADMISQASPPSLHHGQHESGGADEIDCTGLVGAGGGGIAFESLFIQLLFESLDGYLQTTVGTGAIVIDEYGLTLDSGVTQDSQARLDKQNDYLLPWWNWSKNSKFKTLVGLNSQTSVVCDCWIQVGDKNTAAHYGFKVTGGKLYGTVGSGSAESVVELETLGAGAYNINRTLQANLTAGSKVEFYVDDVKLGEITTNLPSGVEYSPFIILLETGNPGVNESKHLRAAQWTYLQEA